MKKILPIGVMGAVLITSTVAAADSFGGEKHAEFLETLTEEQQVVLEEARELKEAGEFEAAHDLIEEAGVEIPNRRARKGMMHAEFLETLTEEQQAVLEQAHELKEAGEFDAAHDLIEEAGIEFPERGGKRCQGGAAEDAESAQ